MDRGEKKGVRQGRPVRRASDIIREADRIIKEEIQKGEKERGGVMAPWVAFLFGVLTATAAMTAIQLLVLSN